MRKHDSLGIGTGVSGKFLGLPARYSSKEHSAIAIVPIPFEHSTTVIHGTRRGPRALIEASRHVEIYDIETDSEVCRLGIYTAPEIRASTPQRMIDKVEQEVRGLLKDRKFVVGIGGEHTIAYPLVKAHAEIQPKFTVLQLDAHADLHEAYEGNVWSHASVIRRIKELPQVTKVISVGLRSLNSHELKSLEREHTFFIHQLRGDAWMKKVVEQIEGPIYLTIDLDVLDCSLMPSTGTPEPGGLDWDQLTKLLKLVCEQKHVIGFDLVELCPNKNYFAADYVAAKLVYQLLSYRFHSKCRYL